MAREDGTSGHPWGTLEELLLVCAVNRHGTKSWDSVAMEVQTKSSSTFASTLLTAQDCRDKFDDLKRRFVSKNDNQSHSLGQMVDELRNLRVDELRHEVHRRDVSIVSLELKVKRLEEERERSLKEEAEAHPNNDLQSGGEDQLEASPENIAGETNSGEEFDYDERENRSFNESNSTSQRGEAKENSVVAKQSEEEEPGPDGNEPDRVRTGTRTEPDRDCSVNGKVIDDEKEDNKKGGETVGATQLGESNEFWESVSESKREGKRGGVASKQNSDVQSSASLSKRKRRRGGGGGEGGGRRSRSRSSSGEEAEGDEVSPATSKGIKLKLVKHEPLIKVLRIIRSHRLGSVFERRLRSQESERYKSLIRQHMDLHEVQSRLNKGVYTDCTHKFFRDLLLLFNNAVVFLRKTSPEHMAAQELRSIVLKEMKDQLQKPQPTIDTVKLHAPKLESKVPKIEPDRSVKPSKPSVVVCGLRRSANGGAGTKSRKGDKKERGEVEEKGKASEVEDKGIRKKRTQERGGRRGSRRDSSKNVGKTEHAYGGNELSSHDGLEEMKMEKIENAKMTKQGAARTFLKRMKQNSTSIEVKRGSSDVSEGGESEDSMVEEDEKKQKGKTKPDERKKRVTRSSTGRRGGRGGGRRDEESSGRAKRGVGRPPKRPETAEAGNGSGKRGRGNGEADQMGSAGRPRKRTRR